MTVKERIHLLVEELDERQTEVAFVLLSRLISESTASNGVSQGAPPGHLLTSDSPFWDIVGLIDDEGPTDLSERVDDYLVDASTDDCNSPR